MLYGNVIVASLASIKLIAAILGDNITSLTGNGKIWI